MAIYEIALELHMSPDQVIASHTARQLSVDWPLYFSMRNEVIELTAKLKG